VRVEFCIQQLLLTVSYSSCTFALWRGASFCWLSFFKKLLTQQLHMRGFDARKEKRSTSGSNELSVHKHGDQIKISRTHACLRQSNKLVGVRCQCLVHFCGKYNLISPFRHASSMPWSDFGHSSVCVCSQFDERSVCRSSKLHIRFELISFSFVLLF